MSNNIVLLTHDRKRVVINKDADVCLYRAPRNPQTRGTDLYAHRARSGNVYFYTYCWSMWQYEEDYCSLVSKAKAEEFLLEKAGLAGCDALSKEEFAVAREFGFDLDTETA